MKPRIKVITQAVRDMSAAHEFYARLFEREPTLVDDRFSGFDLDGVHFARSVPRIWVSVGHPTIRRENPA
jgi:hypothetical protein